MKAASAPQNLLFWFKDGMCCPGASYGGCGGLHWPNNPGGLGFMVTNGKKKIDFTLDKDQVGELACFLQHALSGLRKPLGRKPRQLSLKAMLTKR